MKAKTYFKGIKSACFMLFACLTLTICATSCSSSDEFETDLPEETKQLSKAELLQKYSKAELIDQALSRMPQTRITAPGVVMVTIKDSVTIKVRASGEMTITWGEPSQPSTTIIADGEEHNYSYRYTDGYLSHAIYISDSEQALQSLTVNNSGLISLDVSGNTKLGSLTCMDNYLDEIDLTGCLNLSTLTVANNELTSLDLTCFSNLFSLQVENNRLMDLNLPESSGIFILSMNNNQIKELDLSGAPGLYILEAANNPLRNLNLTQNTNLMHLDVSYSQITDLDLSKNTGLETILLESTPISMINNNVINDTSFAIYKGLQQLNIAHTSSLTALDLSNNPGVFWVDISGSAVTQLDISGSQMIYLYATRSKLTDLICEKKDLTNLYELRIESTPFEKDSTNMETLALALPPRTETNPGHLYTYSRYINDLVSVANTKHWLINQ